MMEQNGFSMRGDEMLRPRIVLNADLAREIYCMKPVFKKEDGEKPKTRGHSLPVSKMYHVSPKAIRDIWNRRTWASATLRLLPAGSELFGSEDQVITLSQEYSFRTILTRLRVS